MLRRIRKYNGTLFMGDLAGGLIAALIALPYGLAMASLMGLPPAMGLFTSILTAPITALLGRNAVMIGGTSSVTVPFIAAAVAAQGVGGAAKVSIVAAILMMTFCVLRLGRYVAKVPLTVVSGFSCGIGALMVISQLKTVMGVAIPNGLSAMGSLFEALYRIDQIKLAPFALGVIVIAAATLSGRLFPKAPAPLLAVLAAVLLGNIFGLHDKELGRLPMEIPPLVGFSWTPTDVISVLPQAFALAFVSSVNLLITSRVVEHFRGKHTPVKAADADRELGAYSIANLAAGVFGAPMSVGIPARSLANVRCGGNSRMSNIFHALFLILFLYVGSDFIAHIPVPALGGVIAWMGFCLLDWSTWRRLHKMRYTDAAAFIVTAISVLLVNAVAAVAFGCLIYMGQSALLRVAAYLENLKPRYVADVTE